MTTELHETHVAEIVARHPETAEVFQANRIDFCCRGAVTVERACADRGLDAGQLLAALSRAIEGRAGSARERDFAAMSVPALIGYIVEHHHAWLRTGLPAMGRMAAKVARVHGEHNPKLVALDATCRELAGLLIRHIDEEEHSLFPELIATSADDGARRRDLAAMASEHLVVGALLERLRAEADDYALPDWACNTYRTLFAELQHLETDIFRHVHLENHLLMPRFAA